MDGPIDWRPDGSLAFTAGAEIEWAAPTVGNKRLASNLAAELATDWNELIAAHKADEDKEDPGSALVALQGDFDDLAAGWVRATHLDIGSGQLPSKVEDWPYWLVSLEFVKAVAEHWGTHPFGLRTTDKGQTENAL